MKSTLLHLRWAFLGAILLVCAGVAAALYGSDLHREASLRHGRAKAASIQAQQRLDSVYAERREIDAYLVRFNTLRTLGALGNENRLDWIERIAAIRDQLRLPRLAYTVEPRLANPLMQDPGAGLRFETSRMRIEFLLLHEGDLLRIIERLRTPVMGVFEVRACSLARVRSATAGSVQPQYESATEGNLNGECLLDWISLTGTRAPEPEAPGAGGNPS